MAGKREKKTQKGSKKQETPGDQGPSGERPDIAASQAQPPAASQGVKGRASKPKPVQPQAPAEELEPPESQERAPCPVAGVGASAGGLEALQGLFTNVPDNLEVAFIVVQHRATDRTSVMKSLIQKHTKLAVSDIADGMEIKPGTIYLAPADRDVSVRQGVLYLVEAPPHAGVHLPIDSFLRTLARDEAERAICIILSGTGSDGTLGLKEIKAAGGVVLAQKEDQAKYDSMPRSAIETGMVDLILPVEKMGEQLAQYIRHPYLERRRTPELEERTESEFQKIFLLIRSQTGHDFSHYKRSTIRRRIARRLAVHQIESLEHYIKLLQEKPEEVRLLAREMLITVTNFFRDREAWESLAEQVIRPLVEQTPPDRALRIWVPGCATGEEAYTVAILFHEQFEKGHRHPVLQIFATDLDEDSVNVGRRGVYPKSVAGDVSAARLKRYFTEEGNSYKVKTSVRETLVFAQHNLIRDAPFSKLDLLCCRNVLIYMDNTLQKKLMPMFHYTLNRGGYLFLGESESIGTFADLFAPVDARHKVFRRKAAQTGYEPQATEAGFHAVREAARENRRPARRGGPDAAGIAERLILRDYSLPCVLVDEDYNILYFNGDTSRYLRQPSGRPTVNIIQMARPEIHFKLNLLLKRAFHEKRLTLEKDIQIRANDHYFDTDIVVRPVAETGVAANQMLVVFQSRRKERHPGEPAAVETDLPDQEKDARVRELEQDLQSTKEYLQTTIEELETSNEELKSSNEELQSTNEELQSTNEELDTSREELQSTNEELRTVNSEHQQKIEELSKAYDDLNNLLAATEVATLFLDRDLKIRRFTPAVRKIFRLIDRDVGRPLDDISTNLQCDDLLGSIRCVLETLTRVDREIVCDGGEWYQMKAVPYRTAENVIEGVVITFIDIVSQKRLLAASEQADSLIEAIIRTVREPLLILATDLKTVEANPAFYEYFQTRPEETVGRRIYDVGGKRWDLPELHRLLEEVVPQSTTFEGLPVQAEFPKLGRRTLVVHARQTRHQGTATGRILLSFEDITDRQKKE